MQRKPSQLSHDVAALGIAALLFASLAAPSGAAQTPTLWGYGVKPCSAFIASAPPPGVAADLGDSDYQRFREWLAGLVSGINLATGSDVLAGAELDAALGRVRDLCTERPNDDFFTASLALIKSLSREGGPPEDR